MQTEKIHKNLNGETIEPDNQASIGAESFMS